MCEILKCQYADYGGYRSWQAIQRDKVQINGKVKVAVLFSESWKTEVNDPNTKTTCLKLRKSTLKFWRWFLFFGFVFCVCGVFFLWFSFCWCPIKKFTLNLKYTHWGRGDGLINSFIGVVIKIIEYCFSIFSKMKKK